METIPHFEIIVIGVTRIDSIDHSFESMKLKSLQMLLNTGKFEISKTYFINLRESHCYKCFNTGLSLQKIVSLFSR